MYLSTGNGLILRDDLQDQYAQVDPLHKTVGCLWSLSHPALPAALPGPDTHGAPSRGRVCGTAWLMIAMGATIFNSQQVGGELNA